MLGGWRLCIIICLSLNVPFLKFAPSIDYIMSHAISTRLINTAREAEIKTFPLEMEPKYLTLTAAPAPVGLISAYSCIPNHEKDPTPSMSHSREELLLENLTQKRELLQLKQVNRQLWARIECYEREWRPQLESMQQSLTQKEAEVSANAPDHYKQ